MIGTAVLYLLYATIYLFTAPLRLLPNVTAESDFINSVTTASTYISAFDTFIPIGTLLTILGLFVTYELSYFSYKLVMWVIKKIPSIN